MTDLDALAAAAPRRWTSFEDEDHTITVVAEGSGDYISWPEMDDHDISALIAEHNAAIVKLDAAVRERDELRAAAATVSDLLDDAQIEWGDYPALDVAHEALRAALRREAGAMSGDIVDDMMKHYPAPSPDRAGLREADVRRMAAETLMDGSVPFKPGADYDSFAAGLGIGIGAFRDRLLAALAAPVKP